MLQGVFNIFIWYLINIKFVCFLTAHNVQLTTLKRFDRRIWSKYIINSRRTKSRHGSSVIVLLQRRNSNPDLVHKRWDQTLPWFFGRRISWGSSSRGQRCGPDSECSRGFVSENEEGWRRVRWRRKQFRRKLLEVVLVNRWPRPPDFKHFSVDDRGRSQGSCKNPQKKETPASCCSSGISFSSCSRGKPHDVNLTTYFDILNVTSYLWGLF